MVHEGNRSEFLGLYAILTGAQVRCPDSRDVVLSTCSLANLNSLPRACRADAQCVLSSLADPDGCLSQVIATFFRDSAFVVGTAKASFVLHNRMLASILRTPLSFFDTTPSGVRLILSCRGCHSTDALTEQRFRFLQSAV